MKKLILVLMVLFTISSCTVDYTAVDETNAPILIKDMDGIVQDAINMEIDTIYVVKHNSNDFYKPLRFMGDVKSVYWSDTTSTGRPIAGSSIYKKIPLNKLYER